MRSSEPRLADRARQLVGGQRALVIGLAREGIDLTRFLTRHGATVRVTDRRSPAEFQEAMAELDASGTVSYRLGGHSTSDLDDADVVYASPGVPPENPLLNAARERGIRLSSLIELFFELLEGAHAVRASRVE